MSWRRGGLIVVPRLVQTSMWHSIMTPLTVSGLWIHALGCDCCGFIAVVIVVRRRVSPSPFAVYGHQLWSMACLSE